MRTPPLKNILGIGFLVLIALYALFQGRFLILGPRINIDSPRDGATLAAGVVTLEGSAQNISFISLNDRPIFLDESGHWSEKLIENPGLSIITLKARDRFGRETAKILHLQIN